MSKPTLTKGIMHTITRTLTIAASFLALAVPATALAETGAQRTVALERVRTEAKRGIRFYHAHSNPGTKDGCGPYAACYSLSQTKQTGDTVTMRWRIRYYTPTASKGTADWTVCTGRVTVRGTPTTDPSRLRAALANDVCIA